MSNSLRATAIVALAVVLSIVWVVYRTVERTQDSNQWVVHTQEVLTGIEAVLSTAVDAESAVRRYLTSGDEKALAPFDRARRIIEADVNHVAALTADNSSQQARAEQLRQDLSRTLAALRAQVEAKRAARTSSPTDAETARVSMEASRATMRSMRAEENRLLAERVQADQAAVRRLQGVSMALVTVAVSLMAWIVWLLARNASRQQQGTEVLRRANEDLESQVGASAADLRDSNARLRSIIDSAVDGIIAIDVKGRIEAFNRGAERLFGYPESEVIGRNVSMLMPSPYHDEHDAYLARYLETGMAKIIGAGRQVTGRRRDGTTFPLHLSVGEMVIQGERKFTGMLHDLTERMRLDGELRTSEARWRSVINSAVDGMVVIDAHGRIEAFNPAAERLFGHEEREVIGRNVNILMPSPYHEEHDTYLARHLATGVQKIIGTGREVTGLRKDGSTFPLQLSVGKMTVDGERKFTGILHDLSARVQIEEQLRERAALARLGEMAAVIAHEVKNPLAGVRGAIQVIGSRLPKDGKDAVMVKEIVSRIDSLNELMKDLLLFARPPQPKLASIDVETLVATTAQLLGSDPALKDVHITVDGAMPRIMADPDLLKIVFVNLLVNGAHAMKGRGTIRVSLAEMPDTCQIAIADEGPGIPSDVREKIFTPFFTTKSRGSGLGLPTAKRLIEAHRGNISIACPSSGGTIVTVELPGSGAAATM
jgi:two-component system, LuxR family, sensor kinase FixL